MDVYEPVCRVAGYTSAGKDRFPAKRKVQSRYYTEAYDPEANNSTMNAVMTDGILGTAAKSHSNLSHALLLIELNNVLNPRIEEGMNVTMVIGLINGVAKTLTLANAGHHAHPLLICDGTVEQLLSKGMPLGMMAGISYREIEFQLQSGDVIVFMTDGIIEAKDNSGTEYQETDRL